MAEVIPAAPNVALLGRDDAVRAQLRTALAELGANLVYEGELRGASASAVSAKQPAVVLLNLDAEGEDALDSLEELLLDPSMRVVFNEAETTAALSGWDLARWARHLAAKVLGHDRTIPPPPAGAEYLPETDLIPTPGAPPSPESQSAALSMATLRSEATASVEYVPASSAPAAGARVAESSKIGDSIDSVFDIDHGDISAAIQSTDSAPAEVLRHSGKQSTSVAGTGIGSGEAAISIDFDELDAALAVIDAGAESEFAGSFGASPGGVGESDSLAAELEALAQSDVVDSDAELEMGVEGVQDRISSSQMKFSSAADEGIVGDELDADVAALAAQLDAMADSAPKGEMDVRDPDFAFDVEKSKQPAPRQAVVRKAASGINFALEDELAEVQAAIPKPAPPPPKIDISFLSLEALPDPGLLVIPTKKKPNEEVYLPRPGIDLMLAPLDAHLEAAPDVSAKPTHAAVEADLSQSFGLDSLTLEPISAPEKSAKGINRIPRVIVLGASIGGPDALRTFLAGLPADFPALLVLAQHLESGFFDRLAQQLQKVSKLPVRVANTDAPACVGEVIVVPSGERVKISRDGRVRREAYSGPTHYRPCIDDVMRDISDEFGKQASAIIFSGMAGDAVEGAVYLTANGGEVWAQTPASCVVSSMVDGAQARGVVEFVGSPRELADHCVARYGDGA